MKGLIQGWLSRQQEKRERRAIGARNAERRALCVEYAFTEDAARRGEIVGRLVELNGEANLKGASERIAYELEGICRRVQPDTIRSAPPAPLAHDHFQADIRHFRREYCGTTYAEPITMPRGVVEDDACYGGEVKA